MNRLERLAPLTGIVAVGLFVAEAIVTGDSPKAHDPARVIVAYWANSGRTHEIGAGLFGLAAVAFVWFGASLRAALREVGDGADRLGSIAHAGTVLIAVGLSVYVSFGLAIVHSVGDVPASTTQTFNVLVKEDTYMFFAVGTALLVLSTAVAVLRYGGLPRWIGWVSLIHGVVALIVLFVGVFVPGLGFVAFLLLVLWAPTVAIVIYRRQPVSA